MADAINIGNQIGNQRKVGLLTIPGVFVSLLPALACPLCWPAYAALLSSIGLGFLISSTYLLPLTGAFLAVALVGLGLQAKKSGYGPLLLGIISVALIVSGKFVLTSSPVNYMGVGLLAAASAWALVPRRRAAAA